VIPQPILREGDLDPSVLDGVTLGIIGYGSQGRAQALNLRDSGYDPVLGLRPGRSIDRARQDGFDPVEPGAAAARSDLLMILVPDEAQASVVAEVVPGLHPAAHIGFPGGFGVHFGLFEIPDTVSPLMVAPKGPGQVLRQRYLSGGGIPALVGARPGDSDGLDLALAYARALGCGRAGVMVTGFREEAVADLFGEQCVLTGGMIDLMKTAFRILVEAGYPAEIAYIECVSEVDYMASLISEVGLSELGHHVSSTAGYGGRTRGRRIVGAGVEAELRKILAEIEDGHFTREFLDSGEAAPEDSELGNALGIAFRRLKGEQDGP
jgi:ketol-acid reductoisomerase